MLNRLIPFGQLILLLGWGFSPLETLAQTVNSSPTVAYSKPICLSRLSTEIDAVINQPQFKRSQWGILLKNLETGEIFYQLNEDKYFIPASNVKLLTSAVALLTLGKEFQIRTSFYASEIKPKLNRLTVVGRGDPSLTTEALKTQVKRLKELGVKQIDQLVVNSSYFPNEGVNPTWEWDDLPYYYAPFISSLTLNDNQVTLTLKPQELGEALKIEWSDEIAGKQWKIVNKTITGEKGSANTITLHPQRENNVLEVRGTLGIDTEMDTFRLAILNPNQYFLDSLKALLTQEGIEVNQTDISNDSEIKGQEILTINSPKLPELLNKINQDSNNSYAENLHQIILKEVDQTNAVLEDINQDSRLIDGSGLSRWNLVTPETFVNLLTLIYQNPDYPIYKESLAIAGKKGTLKNRFVNTPIQGKLWGKTGSLNGVSSLSGYLELEENSPIVFSIIINYSDQPSPTLRQGIDDIILSLSQFPQCIKK